MTLFSDGDTNVVEAADDALAVATQSARTDN
jgi:hypothetical protein